MFSFLFPSAGGGVIDTVRGRTLFRSGTESIPWSGGLDSAEVQKVGEEENSSHSGL